MRVLGVGDSCEASDLYLRLAAEGHDVRVYIRDHATLGVMEGMLERVDDWRAELDWVRDGGIVLFEDAAHGAEQDALRDDGLSVIGGSAWGDRMESERGFAQRVLADLGLQVIPARTFESANAAIDHIRERPGRYVSKLDGSAWASWRNYVGQTLDGSDVIAWLQAQNTQLNQLGSASPAVLLMQHVHGVEMGTGAYFDGARFLQPACLDWEHKHFFPGNIGELTGEMGTLVTYRRAERLFDATLAKLAPLLHRAGHVGYVNLNTIVNDDGIWPLELTCRFGYPGSAVLGLLQRDGWGALLRSIADRSASSFATHTGYALGVVVTVPPFPYPHGYASISKGLPIVLDSHLCDAERAHLCWNEVALQNGHLIASGSTGQLLTVVGVGATARAAQADAYHLVDKVFVPNARYRNDIGSAFIARDQRELRRLGYLS